MRLNILLVIPRNQFAEEELFKTRETLDAAGAHTLVLSSTGKEAVGTNRTRFLPDGLVIDWNKQDGVVDKYNAVLLIGGKGAQKFLWDDALLPLILTDHYRAGSVIGAVGLAVAALARGAFLTGREAAGPQHELFLKELDDAGAYHVDQDVVCSDRIVTARGGEAAEQFANRVLQILQEGEPR